MVPTSYVPVVIAGGPKMETEIELFEMVYDAIQVGGGGVAIGRNIFQAKDPTLNIQSRRSWRSRFQEIWVLELWA